MALLLDRRGIEIYTRIMIALQRRHENHIGSKNSFKIHVFLSVYNRALASLSLSLCVYVCFRNLCAGLRTTTVKILTFSSKLAGQISRFKLLKHLWERRMMKKFEWYLESIQGGECYGNQ